MSSRFATLRPLLATAVLSCWAPCWAQAPAAASDEAPAARFEVVRFQVEGNTILPSAEVERAVAPYVGKNRDFGDIQRALEALEQAFRARGYGIVQVLLPEQDITRGVVQLRVTEPKLGKVTVEGNKFFSEANVRRSLPTLKPGAVPNSGELGKNLQLLGEHPAKQTTVLLRAGASDNEVDATVKVIDEKPLKFVVTADNTGTQATGRFRTGIALQHSNLFDRDHTLNLQYVTNPEHPSNVAIYGAGYRIPFYARNSALDIFAGYSDVNSGTLQGLFNVAGSGTILGTRYNIYLDKIGDYEHKIAFGLDYRAFKNTVVTGGVGIVPDITVHPASVSYNGLWRTAESEYGFYASYSRNIPGGNDGKDSDFKVVKPGYAAPARVDGASNYKIWRGGAHYSRAIATDWQLRAVFNGQYSNDALIPGEQFGFGGPDSLRGFNVREVSNDKGYIVNVEVYTPDFGSRFGNDLRARALAFYDHGNVRRNSIQPGEGAGATGASVGLGLRLAMSKALSLRLDMAKVIDPAGAQGRNDLMLHAAMALQF